MAHDAGAGDSGHDAEAMRQLRSQALVTPPAQLGIAPSEDFPIVYGAVMDWPVGEETATVVAFCDGNVSLYTTSTFGVIGGVGHACGPVQRARLRPDCCATIRGCDPDVGPALAKTRPCPVLPARLQRRQAR